MPHGHCYLWKPEILWLNVGGDSLIAFAYYSIPPMLFFFARKRKDLAHKYVFVLFGLFILACGTTHLIDIVTVWTPVYRLEGIVKVFTGVVSLGTAVVLYQALPTLLSLPSPEQLSAANLQLRNEVAEKERAQAELKRINEQLEERVQERTKELQKVNESLEREIEVRKIAEEALKQKNEELRHINTDLDDFVYCASHDLKAPIINAEALLGALREDLPPHGVEVDNLIERMEQSLVQINRTIADLTTVSQVQKEERNKKLEVVALPELFEQVKENFQNEIYLSDITVEADFSAADTVWFSRRHMQSILHNLLSNAIKYRDPNRHTFIKISTQLLEDYVILSISDNGLGIDLSKHEKKMFSLFRRIHDHVDGSGVGLYLVKRIVENNSGKVTVESEVGKGTTFHIFVPVNKKQPYPTQA